MKELLIGKHPAEIENWQRNALHLGFITISKLESNLLQKKGKEGNGRDAFEDASHMF